MREKTISYSEESLENLVNGIIMQAVNDYRKALSEFSSDGKSDTDVIAKCERFFRSEWFRVLTNVDGEYLITNIRKEYRL